MSSLTSSHLPLQQPISFTQRVLNPHFIFVMHLLSTVVALTNNPWPFLAYPVACLPRRFYPRFHFPNQQSNPLPSHPHPFLFLTAPLMHLAVWHANSKIFEKLRLCPSAPLVLLKIRSRSPAAAAIQTPLGKSAKNPCRKECKCKMLFPMCIASKPILRGPKRQHIHIHITPELMPHLRLPKNDAWDLVQPTMAKKKGNCRLLKIPIRGASAANFFLGSRLAAFFDSFHVRFTGMGRWDL